MASYQRIVEYFSTLEACLKKEFSSKGFKYQIFNKSSSPVPCLEIETEFKAKDITLSILTTLGKSFPKKPPSIMLQTSCQSDIVDPKTREIRWETLYPWKDTQSRLSELLRSLELHFQAKPPKINPDVEFAISRIKKIQEEIAQTRNLDPDRIEAELSPQELVKLYKDEESCKSLLRSLPEFQVLYKKLADLQEDSLKCAEQIYIKETEVKDMIEKSKPQISSYQDAKKNYAETLDNYNLIKNRFNKSSILQYLEKRIADESKEAEELQKQVLAGHFEDFASLEELTKKRQNLILFKKIKKLTMNNPNTKQFSF